MGEAGVRMPMRIIAYCLLPNYFHFVLWPRAAGDLSRWMHWVLTTHVRRYLRHYGHRGHVWQGRFKAFLIQQDQRLFTVIRYVERNPLRAGLVVRAEDWIWSSLRPGGDGPVLDPGPAPREADWCEFVNHPMTEAEVAAIRLSLGATGPTVRTPGPARLPPCWDWSTACGHADASGDNRVTGSESTFPSLPSNGHC
jgi:putative transposase